MTIILVLACGLLWLVLATAVLVLCRVAREPAATDEKAGTVAEVADVPLATMASLTR